MPRTIDIAELNVPNRGVWDSTSGMGRRTCFLLQERPHRLPDIEETRCISPSAGVMIGGSSSGQFFFWTGTPFLFRSPVSRSTLSSTIYLAYD